MTDNLPALSPEARAVLDALRGAHDPPPDTAARVRPALDARVRRVQTRARYLRWGVALGLVALVALLVARTSRRPAPPPPPQRVTPRLTTPPTPPTATPLATVPPPVAQPVAHPIAAPAPSPPRAPMAVPPCSTGVELRAIREADAALRAGDAASALRTTRALARRCPQGAMVEEREALRVMALCRAREPTASAELRRFLTTWPRSPIHERVEAQCAAP